jgi:superfamily II DNA or RNA helicase
MKRDLRPHQSLAIEKLRQSLGSGKRRPVLQAPTGFGKTRLAAAVIEGALAKDKRVIFTVPALSLVDQTVEAFWNDGVRNIGVIQGCHGMTDWSRPVQVASVQTLQRRQDLPQADVVIIDECHRWFDFYPKWMMDPAWQNRPFIGLSATPWTRGLGRYFDDLIIAATTKDLITAGYLSPFRVFAPSHPDLTGVRTVAGDYHEGDLSGVMNDSTLVADVVDTWLGRAQNRSTFCFAVDRAHAKHLQQQFITAGVSTGYIDAYTPSKEREDIHRKFQDGQNRIVCNVGCLTTGIDWDVRCIILARPTKSEMLFVQIIGRGLRPAEGKEDCLILDHSDTHLRPACALCDLCASKSRYHPQRHGCATTWPKPYARERMRAKSRNATARKVGTVNMNAAKSLQTGGRARTRDLRRDRPGVYPAKSKAVPTFRRPELPGNPFIVGTVAVSTDWRRVGATREGGSENSEINPWRPPCLIWPASMMRQMRQPTGMYGVPRVPSLQMRR